ncbi:hypothetical protein Acsp05_00340 [Actinokineospora sp. NBRC 105648]|nr:hypothetical protein Acsp05_00340 [Actinokineospora sp. NBRC 105648]
MRRTVLVLALAVTGVLLPATASADTRPPGCASHFRTPDVRERTINRDTYLHEMSNPPVCSPHGPVLGTMRAGSHFRVYHADPYEPLWCYGYSVQLGRTGYVLCEAYD